MIVEKQDTVSPATPARPDYLPGRPIPWFRLLLSLLLGGLGLWFVLRGASLTEIIAALQQARPGFVLLALGNIFLTGLVKSWRWQNLFGRRARPPFASLFWTVHLAQLANTAVPFFRVSEIVRIVHLDRSARTGKARTLGTLVVEKTLEMVTLALTLLILIPFLVVPAYVRESGLALALTGTIIFAALWLLAYRTAWVNQQVQHLAGRLPTPAGRRLTNLITSGLDGLASLRDGRAGATVLFSSALVAFLYVLTPYLLLHAYGLNLTLVEAAAIHVVLTIGTVPSWAPANVGIFEFLVAFMLRYFGQTDPGLIVAYTFTLHLVIVLPQIVLGGLGALLGGYPRPQTNPTY